MDGTYYLDEYLGGVWCVLFLFSFSIKTKNTFENVCILNFENIFS